MLGNGIDGLWSDEQRDRLLRPRRHLFPPPPSPKWIRVTASGDVIEAEITEKLRVESGWLYRTTVFGPSPGFGSTYGRRIFVALAFVPDPPITGATDNEALYPFDPGNGKPNGATHAPRFQG